MQYANVTDFSGLNISYAPTILKPPRKYFLNIVKKEALSNMIKKSF